MRLIDSINLLIEQIFIEPGVDTPSIKVDAYLRKLGFKRITLSLWNKDDISVEYEYFLPEKEYHIIIYKGGKVFAIVYSFQDLQKVLKKLGIVH